MHFHDNNDKQTKGKGSTSSPVIPLEARPAWPGARWPGARPPKGTQKGTNGVSTDGVAANCVLFDRGTFGVLYLFIFPKVPGCTLFPQNVSKFITFVAAPLVLTPFVRNQEPLWRRSAQPYGVPPSLGLPYLPFIGTPLAPLTQEASFAWGV